MVRALRRKKAKKRKQKPTARPKPRKHDDSDPVEGTDELPPSGGSRTIGERAAGNGN